MTFVLGIFIVYCMSVVYRQTRGGSKAWIIFALSFSAMGLWAVLDSLFVFLVPNLMADMASETLLLSLVILNPIGVIILIRDMKIDVPEWVNVRNYLIMFIGFIVIIALYNFVFTPFTDLWAELVSITLMTTSFSHFLSSFGDYALYRGTGLKFWLYICIAALLASGALFLTVAYLDCCGDNGPLYGSEACIWESQYTETSLLPCMEFVVPIISLGAPLLIVAEIFAIYGFFRIMRAMNPKRRR